MGTTLTGTTPQDTYDSLIKVTDNGPLSGSLKTLTDGLGNDSALALSTGAASVTGALSVSLDGLFGGSTNAGNAGTNTLSVGVAGTTAGGLQLWAANNQTHFIQFGDGTSGAQVYAGLIGYAHSDDALYFGSAATERMRINSAGNVGIGTSSPTTTLDVAGTGRIKSSVGDYLLTIENIQDDSQGLLVRASDNDSLPILKLQSSVGATSETWVDRFVVNKDGNVGIGTDAPTQSLDTAGKLRVRDGGNTTIPAIQLATNGVSGFSNPSATDIAIITNSTERVRITEAGNVGIGTDNPLGKLTVSDGTNALYVSHNANGPYISSANNANTVYKRQSYDALEHVFLVSAVERARFTANGLTFNGDTAAANALDDYEEGTWTPVLRGASTAGIYELSVSNAVYTKIGRQVTASCEMALAAVITGGGTAYAQITGLPFAKGAGQQAVGSVFLSGVDFTADYIVVNFTSSGSTSVLYFSEVRDNALGGDMAITAFAATDSISFTITYNV
jgi:hypothetical protein